MEIQENLTTELNQWPSVSLKEASTSDRTINIKVYANRKLYTNGVYVSYKHVREFIKQGYSVKFTSQVTQKDVTSKKLVNLTLSSLKSSLSEKNDTELMNIIKGL